MKQTNTDETCATCRLPIRRGAKRKGSLTAWMFADISCRCDTPGIIREAGQGAQAPVPASGDLQVGGVFENQYKVLSLVGRGGMGTVYKVMDLSDNKEYALKTLNSESSSQIAWRRFEKEANAAGLLDHPTLVKVHKYGTANDERPYFIMEFVDGQTLAERLKQQGPLAVAEALDLFIQVSVGLAYAHTRGVIHRDLKPSNVLLTSADASHQSVKIVDFGIAKLVENLDEESGSVTNTGDVFGTPFYMSPEQCLGSRVDQRSDIYSLGCVFYECLVGLPPFTGASPLTIMMKHQSEIPASLKQASLGKEFPDALETVVAKLLQKDPNNRYQNLYEFADDLNRMKEGRQISPDRGSQGSVAGNRGASPGLVFAAIAVGLTLLAGGFWAGQLTHQVDELKDSKPGATTTGAALNVIGDPEGADAIINRGPDRLKLSNQAQHQAERIICNEDGKPFSLKDFDLQILAADKKLAYLDLSGLPISGQGLVYLKGLPIENLSLSHTDFGDSAVPLIKDLPKLKNLQMEGTRVTYQGLKQLAALVPRVAIDLGDDPRLNLDELSRLKSELPNCHVKPSARAALLLTSVDQLISMKDYARAEVAAKEALSIYEREGGQSCKGAASAHLMLGSIANLTNNIDDADAHTKEALRIFQILDDDPDSKTGFVFALRQLGQVQEKRGNLKEATLNLSRAFTESKGILPRSERAEMVERLAAMYRAQNMAQEARNYEIVAKTLRSGEE